MRTTAWPVAGSVGPTCRCLALALMPGIAAADPSDLCLLAARDAAAISGVPLSVLVAVTQTETGRNADGETRPWPWTVNLEGEGHWFETREAALNFAEAALAAGETSFDIGCFQINYHWHGENFVSLDQMFDPMANATYAAGFLARLQAETGDWSTAAGSYHSRSEEFADRYRSRFDQFRNAAVVAGADDGTLLLAEASSDAPANLLPRVNSFPFLQQGSSQGVLGSLVPLTGGG